MESEAARRACPEAGGPAKEEILAELAQKLAQLSGGRLPADAIDPSANLIDYGYIDSLSGVSLIAHVEERYGVRIEDLELIETLTSLDTVADRILDER